MIRVNKKLAMALGLSVASMIGFAACDMGGGGGGGGGGLPPGIAKFNVAGPERVTTQRVGICTRFLPPQGAVDSRGGLGWGNGTFATPDLYAAILTRVASFGTLVSAANTSNAGRGTEVAQCINELDAARSDSNGRFATAGHSQGGSGSINAARLNNKVVVTCPVQLDGIITAQSNPADLRGTRTGPALIMCGGGDVIAPCTSVNNGDTKFNQARVPVTRISVVGAPHIGANSPVGAGGLYPALVTTCVEAAVGGDAQASAALQPGGAQNNGTIDRIASRNF